MLLYIDYNYNIGEIELAIIYINNSVDRTYRNKFTPKLTGFKNH